MSDLAPFVAATIRDKVIEDLIQENNRLRKKLETSRTVAVTGPEGSPKYASADFSKGEYMGNLWDISLSPSKPKTKPIFLSALANLEVQVGGVAYATTIEGLQAGMDEHELDGEDQKSVSCHFGDSERGVWVIILIKGWPKSSWSELQRADYAARREDGEANVYGVICENIAMLYLDATVSFLALSFFRSGVKKAIDNLELDPSVEQTRMKQLEDRQFADELIERLRDAGNDDYGPGFFISLCHLEEVLAAFGIKSEEHDDYEIVVDRLIELQMRTGDNFKASVRRHLHEITRGTNILRYLMQRSFQR